MIDYVILQVDVPRQRFVARHVYYHGVGVHNFRPLVPVNIWISSC